MLEAGCCGVDSPGLGLAQQGLELGEDLLDGIEIGTVGRQEEELGADGAPGGSYGDALVGAEIVHYSSLAPRPYLCARLLETLD